MCDDCPSPEGFSIATGATTQAYAPARNHAEAITSCAYNALHSNNAGDSDKPIQCQVTTLSIGVVTDDAGDNTNVLIVLHPFGIGIALARHQQLQDAIHILW